MKSDRLEALLWARVDGTIDESELDELQGILAAGGDSSRIEPWLRPHLRLPGLDIGRQCRRLTLRTRSSRAGSRWRRAS